MSLQEIISCCEKIKSLFKNEDEIAEVESQTRTQSTRQEWYKHRFGGRVTALESHRVGCTHKVGTSPSKIIKEVLNSDNNYQSQAM